MISDLHQNEKPFPGTSL